jgi:hypothetical protein
VRDKRWLQAATVCEAYCVMAESGDSEYELEEGYGDDDFIGDDDDEILDQAQIGVPSSVASSIAAHDTPPLRQASASVQSTDSISEGMEALRARARGLGAAAGGSSQSGGSSQRGNKAELTKEEIPAQRRQHDEHDAATSRRIGAEQEKQTRKATTETKAGLGTWNNEEEVVELRKFYPARKQHTHSHKSAQQPPALAQQQKQADPKRDLTPPTTPALMVKPDWCHKLELREAKTRVVQRVLRGHFARRAWAKPLLELKRWRHVMERQHASKRRPMLVHIAATSKQDEGWLRGARRSHLLVPIACPDKVKWFPNTKAIKVWWSAVPDNIRRLFDVSQAQVLPRWENAVPDVPREALGVERDIGPAASSGAIKKTEALHPRVTGGNFPRAPRFPAPAAAPSVLQASATSSAPTKHTLAAPHGPPEAGLEKAGGGAREAGAPSAPKVPRLRLGEGGGRGGGGEAEVEAASARIERSLGRGGGGTERAAQLTLGYKALEEQRQRLAQRQAASQQVALRLYTVCTAYAGGIRQGVWWGRGSAWRSWRSARRPRSR